MRESVPGIPGRLLRSICALQIAITYLVSSLFINALQAIVWCSVFLSKEQRATMSGRLMTSWMDLPRFLVTGLGGVKVVMKGDPNFAVANNECGVMVANHSLGLDVFGALVSMHALGVESGSVYALMKSSLKFVPAVGWVMWLNGSLFLSRDYKRDKAYIERRVREICESYPRPFWVGIYPEGTRITDEKRQQSQEFSRKRGLPVLDNVLMPRAKGIGIMMEQGRKFGIDTVFNLTFAYEGGEMYLRDIFYHGKFKTRAVHVYAERAPIASVPQDETGLRDWLIDSFVQKDKRLEHFKKHQSLPGGTITPRVSNDASSGYVLWTVVTALAALYTNIFAPWQFALWLALTFFGVSSSSNDDGWPSLSFLPASFLQSFASSLSSVDVAKKALVSDCSTPKSLVSSPSPSPIPSNVDCISIPSEPSEDVTVPSSTSQTTSALAR